MGRGAASISSILGLALLLVPVTLSVPAGQAAENTSSPAAVDDRVLPSGEIPGFRTRTSRTFVAERGTYRTELFTRSINYQDEAGGWQPIDSTLVPALAPGYALRNKANRYTLQLPPTLAVAPVRISQKERWVSFSLEGAQGVLQQQSNRASYSHALPHVKVEYEARADSVKETLVLESAQAASSFRFLVHASAGLEATLEGNSVALRDAAGRTAFTFSPPFMVDAAGERSEQVSFALAPAGTGWELTLTASRAWLSAPGRSSP
jgi:hypothetical protein